jgi:hypothetical protein
VGSRRDAARQKIGDFYATSWAVIHYLMQTPKGRSELSRFERELAKGTPLEQAREVAFARSFAQLDSELATHIGYLARGVAGVSVLDPTKIALTEPAVPEPVSRGEVARELGSIALAVASESADEEEDDGGLSRVARVLLQVAVDEEPTSARSSAALARARALDGDPDGAAETLSGALRAAPGDVQVQLAAAHVALAAEDDGEAQARFRSANRTRRALAVRLVRARPRARARGRRGWRARSAHARAPPRLELAARPRARPAPRRRAAPDQARALLQPLAADPPWRSDRQEGHRAARGARRGWRALVRVRSMRMRRLVLIGSRVCPLRFRSPPPIPIPANTVTPRIRGSAGLERFLVCAPQHRDLASRRAAEQHRSAARQIDAYLRFHDRKPQSLDLFACQKLWTQRWPRRRARLARTDARVLRAQARRDLRFDAIVMPSLILQTSSARATGTPAGTASSARCAWKPRLGAVKLDRLAPGIAERISGVLPGHFDSPARLLAYPARSIFRGRGGSTSFNEIDGDSAFTGNTRSISSYATTCRVGSMPCASDRNRLCALPPRARGMKGLAASIPALAIHR